MTLKLLLTPEPTSYSVQDGEGIVRQSLSGGAGRYRADILNATKTVSCQWSVSPGDFNYLRAFYNHHTRTAAWFQIDLMVDSFALVEHRAHFLPGGLKLGSTQGLMQTVSCQLEVVPIDNAQLDAAILDLVSADMRYADLLKLLRRLSSFANEDLRMLDV